MHPDFTCLQEELLGTFLLGAQTRMKAALPHLLPLAHVQPPACCVNMGVCIQGMRLSAAGLFRAPWAFISLPWGPPGRSAALCFRPSGRPACPLGGSTPLQPAVPLWAPLFLLLLPVRCSCMSSFRSGCFYWFSRMWQCILHRSGYTPGSLLFLAA